MPDRRIRPAIDHSQSLIGREGSIPDEQIQGVRMNVKSYCSNFLFFDFEYIVLRSRFFHNSEITGPASVSSMVADDRSCPFPGIVVHRSTVVIQRAVLDEIRSSRRDAALGLQGIAHLGEGHTDAQASSRSPSVHRPAR